MNRSRHPAPWHLWAVGIVTLLWNSVGVMSYMMTRLAKLDTLGLTPDQIAWFDSFPMWANAVWALGIWGAFATSLLLLLRSRWAVVSAAISVIGLIGTTWFNYAVATVPAELANPALDATIWVTTLFTLWYAVRMRREGVLA
ncbi:hypothetical protein U4960_04260 [Altererythrobacter sp. H2]|uniref:hypothetical protein n=1 Tax=Altererythrobacter sp. H2 TaxID=3108391 RepID=UPI002B4BF718|nr:hypothetical protein [Altererythrobacter sp. H2]WRK96546.1 hypothetical protein U4960_04260 [Altererythrobacter sp. H2]